MSHRTVALLGLLALVLVLTAARAMAHEAPTGWAYDPACCSNRDCAPAAAKTISENAEGWLVDGKDFVARGKERRSGDEFFHVCRSVYDGRLLCLYAPNRGF